MSNDTQATNIDLSTMNNLWNTQAIHMFSGDSLATKKSFQSENSIFNPNKNLFLVGVWLASNC